MSSMPMDHDTTADDPAVQAVVQGSADPEVSDHGAWDAPTVGAAADDAVRGGMTTVARSVGAGIGVGVTAIRRAGSALRHGTHGVHRH